MRGFAVLLLLSLLSHSVTAYWEVAVYQSCDDYKTGWEPDGRFTETECDDTSDDDYPWNSYRMRFSHGKCRFRTFNAQYTECDPHEQVLDLAIGREQCVEESGMAFACISDDPFVDLGYVWYVVAGTSVLVILGIVLCVRSIRRCARRRAARKAMQPPVYRCQCQGRAPAAGVAAAPGQSMHARYAPRIQGAAGGASAAAGVASPLYPLQWVHSLFECQCDSKTGIAWCCTPCSIAETRRRFYNYSDSRCLAEGLGLVLADTLLLGLGVGIMLPATSVAALLTRSDMRGKRGYIGTPLEDALASCLCTCCTAVQIERDQTFYDYMDLEGSPAGLSSPGAEYPGASAPEVSPTTAAALAAATVVVPAPTQTDPLVPVVDSKPDLPEPLQYPSALGDAPAYGSGGYTAVNDRGNDNTTNGGGDDDDDGFDDPGQGDDASASLL